MSTNSKPLTKAAPRRGLAIVLLTLFIDLLGFSILFPIFAEMMLYYQQQGDPLLMWCADQLERLLPGVGEERLAAFFGGAVLGIYALLQFLTAPLWGRLSDRIGRRPVLLLTTVGNLVGYLLWIVSGTFAILLLGRVINGLAAGNIATLTAAASDLSSTQKRTRVMAAVGATFGAGFLLGPAIGGMAFAWLPNLHGLGWGLNAFSSIAILAAGLTLVNLVLIYTRLPETCNLADAQRPDSGKPSLLVLQRIRPLHWAYFIFMVSFTAMELALVFMVADILDFRPQDISWLFVVIGGTSIIIQGGVVRRLSQVINDRVFAIFGLLVLAVGLSGLALVSTFPHGWLVFLSAILVSLGSATIFPSMTSWVSKLAPQHAQGACLGRLRSLGALARVIGPFACAIIYFSFGAAAPFAIGAAILAIPLVLVFRALAEDDATVEVVDPVAAN